MSLTGQHLLVPGVIGRERELAELAAFVADIPRGFRVVVLHGEAGAGKTTLVRAAGALAREQGLALLACAGSELETELSYAALGDLLDPLLGAGLAGLPGPQRRAIEVALSLADPPDDPPDQRAVAVATLGVLTAAAARRPLVLAIDDVQWLDGSSERVLAFAARRMDSAAVGLLIARRGSGPALGVERGVEPERVRMLDVGPLPIDAIGRLLQKRLGTPVARPRLQEIHRASGGNPFYALELARALDDRPSDAGRPLSVPASLREVVAARLEGIGHPARQVLLLAACMVRADAALLRTATADADAGLAEAAEAGLVAGDGDDVVRFTHPLLAYAVYEDATEAQRRAAHRVLAELADGEERAHHLALATAEPDEEVALTLEDAARRARARAAPEAAARFASEAARLTVGPLSRRLERRLEAGRAHAAAGDPARARRELDAVIAAAAPGPLRARALHARAAAAWGTDGYLEDAALLTRALADAGGERGLEALIRLDLATALLQVGQLRDAQLHARRAVALAEGPPAAEPLGAALTVSVMADFLLGEGIRDEWLDRASALGASESRTAMAPGFLRVLLLKWTDRLGEARAALETLRAQALADHDDQRLGFVLVQLGELYWWLGDLDGVRDCERAERVVMVHGAQEGTLAPFLEAVANAMAGDVEPARAAATAAAEMAQATANNRFHIRCLALLGVIELSAGDARAAAAYLRRAEAMSSEAGYGEPGVLRFEHDAVEALLAVGERDHAQRICARLEACGRRHGRPWAIAAATRSRALLESAAGDLDAAERDLQDALGGFRTLGQPLETGRTLLHLGGVRRRRRQKRAAREALDAAAETFASVGATAWLARARDEAARIGGRPAAPRELSEVERRVAELAADGATNREIADELFISVKTVERHLSHTYAKLGVGSRRELRGAMGSKARDAPRFHEAPPDLSSQPS